MVRTGTVVRTNASPDVIRSVDDGAIQLQSRRGTSLTTAFSDIAEAAERDFPEEVFLGGEVVIWRDGRLTSDGCNAD
ncbi:hypothetical protein ADK86_39915 [Streptomyces sp. NRRL F-5755]|nr:hypothetical protein ADK86_39915 [Streptomyces sp. NRRL F-5755]